MTATLDVPQIEVHAALVRGTWLLTYASPCPDCGRIHRHGGDRGAQPPYGTRGKHCLDDHRPFRNDCVPEHRVLGERGRCHVPHGGDMVELVPFQVSLHSRLTA